MASHEVSSPRTYDDALSNEEIRSKWSMLADRVLSEDRKVQMEEIVLNMESLLEIQCINSFLYPFNRSCLLFGDHRIFIESRNRIQKSATTSEMTDAIALVISTCECAQA